MKEKHSSFYKEINQTLFFIKPWIWTYFSGMFLMTAMFALINVLESFSLKYIVNSAIEQNAKVFWLSLSALFLCFSIVFVLTPFFAWWYNSTAKLASGEVMKTLFQHIQHLPLTFFDRTHSGEIVSRMTNDTETMSQILGGRLRRFVAPSINSLIFALGLLILNWKIGSLLILFNFLATVLNLIYAKPIRKISDRYLSELSKMTENLLDTLSGMRILKMFHLEEKLYDTYQEKNQDIKKLGIKSASLEGALISTNFILRIISSIGVVLTGSLLISSKLIDIGSLIAIIHIQSRLNSVMLDASRSLPILQDSLAGSSRVFAFLDEKEEVQPVKPENPGNFNKLDLSNIKFGYNEKSPVLDDITFSVCKGEIMALVGPSGSGKSTLFKLIHNFYPIEYGEIRLNNIPISNIPLEKLWEYLAYVSQDIILFEGTIDENIRFGNKNAKVEDIIYAAKSAYAHDFIMKQPQGYQTLVGERGVKLSGGQKQRIAIARAILKNAPLLLLDEATSALDSRSEEKIQRALDELMQNRTTLVIAHRLSTIQHADNIYVLNQGKIIESGDHETLLKNSGLYTELYEHQFKF